MTTLPEVAAAIDDLLDHFVNVLKNHEFLRVVWAVVEILDQIVHHLIGFALGPLQDGPGLR